MEGIVEKMSLEELVLLLEKKIKSTFSQDLIKEVNAIKGTYEFIHQDLFLEAKASTQFADEYESLTFEFQHATYPFFRKLMQEFNEKKKSYFHHLEDIHRKNLYKRKELLQELITFVDDPSNVSQYPLFKEILLRWKNVGPIAHSVVTNVFSDFNHHVERFYDLLHLQNDLRILDFKHNLKLKQEIIAKAKDLLTYNDVTVAFDELQLLHKIWKEETGPVSKEFREVLWNDFSAISTQIHAKRDNYLKSLRELDYQNLIDKKAIITTIKNINLSLLSNSSDWKNMSLSLDKLKAAFKSIGNVPKNEVDELYNDYRDALAVINHGKNEYYRQLKLQFSENLQARKDLIEIARTHVNTNDFEKYVPVYKKIQNDWRKLGYVPKKDSDILWNEFKQTCNLFFDRYQKFVSQGTQEESIIFQKKTAFLETLQHVSITQSNCNEVIAEWKQLGFVHKSKLVIETEIYHLLQEKVVGNFTNEVEIFFLLEVTHLYLIDQKSLDQTYLKLRKELENNVSTVKQLENNLGFVKSSNSSIFKNVVTTVQELKEAQKLLKSKLRIISDLLKNNQ